MGEDEKNRKLHGCMLYFENTLISSYVRTFPDRSRIETRPERDRFGALLVCNLTKKQGFTVDEQKVNFKSTPETKAFWSIAKDTFNT